MKTCPRLSALCALFVTVAASSARGQFSSSVQGNVVDPSDALVAGARLKISNVETGVAGTRPLA